MKTKTDIKVSARLCGTNRVPEEIVRSIKAPAFTDSWHPISHDTVISLLEKNLSLRGLHVSSKEFQLSQDGHRMFGTYILNGETQRPDYAFAVGLRNSTDKAFPAGFAFGTRVFVCENLMFSGDIVIARKHTPRIAFELPHLMMNAIRTFENKRVEINQTFDSWKEQVIGPGEVLHDFLWRLGMESVVPFEFLKNSVYPLFNKSLHDSHMLNGKRTVWTLHNAFSEAFKKRQEKNPFTATNEQFEITTRMRQEFPIANVA